MYDLLMLLFQSNTKARLAAAAILLAVFFVLLFKHSRQPADTRAVYIFSTVFILMGCTFVFSPVLYPWYLCWIIPLMAIVPNRAWLMLSSSIFLSYLIWKGYVEAGIWQENMWVKLAEYAPFYGLLLYDGLRNLNRRDNRQ
jgi:hypothetical protein